MASDRATLEDLLLNAKIDGKTTDETAEDILADGWRPPAQVVSDPAELASLPTGAIGVVDGYATQLLAGTWWEVSGRSQPVRSHALIAMYGPVTLISIPIPTEETTP